MTIFDGGKVYEKMGVTPAVNTLASGTVVGGSTPVPEVKAAMDNTDLWFGPFVFHYGLAAFKALRC